MKHGAWIAVWLLAIGIAGGCTHQPLEDEPGWNCHVHGNQICGEEIK